MKRRALVVASTDDRDDGCAKAQELARGLNEQGIETLFVNKQGFDLKLLKLVAEHRILYTPTVILYERSAIVARLTRLPSVDEVKQVYAYAAAQSLSSST